MLVGIRWEFDRAKLFKRTKYMAKICGDLMVITKMLEQFYKFLGPELKEVRWVFLSTV